MLHFAIKPDELEKFVEWRDRLDDANEGAIGGRFTFSFTPTSLGEAIKVKDNVSGEEIDLTDYEDW